MERMISNRLVWYLERNRLISAILFFLILYFCVCAFMLLCSILCFIGNIVIIISYHERPARWIIPFWQPAYPLHLCTHVCFSHSKYTLLLLCNAASANNAALPIIWYD